MKLFQSAGIAQKPAIDAEALGDEGMALLVDAAYRWLCSGMSLREWNDLTEVEQTAIVVARDRQMRDIAQLFALAMRDPLGVREANDNGEEKSNIALAVAVATASERVKGTVIE